MIVGRFDPYSFATFQFGGTAPPGGYNYDPKTKKLTPTAGANANPKSQPKGYAKPVGGSLGGLINTSGRTPTSNNNNRTPSVGGGTAASEKCGGCDSFNIGCELGKFSCEFTNGIRGWWDGMGESFGKGFSEFGMLPMMALGLGGLIVIAVLFKR